MWAWLTSLTFSAVKPYLKWVAIGGGALFVGWLIWQKIDTHLTDYRTLIANEAKLKAAEAANVEVVRALNAQIEMLNRQAIEDKEVLKRQSQIIEKANEYKDDVEQILAKHNLEKLMAAKPGLVENVFNNGTDKYFRMLEARSQSLSDYYASTDRDMSPTIRIAPATPTETPSR